MRCLGLILKKLEIYGFKSFLKNKGLGNEVGYYIFDYSPKDELYVRSHIAYLKEKLNKSHSGMKIVEFDLYSIVFDVLKERGYLEKCFEFEKTKGLDFTIEAIIKMLKLTNKSNLVVNHIVENTPDNSVVFITGSNGGDVHNSIGSGG